MALSSLIDILDTNFICADIHTSIIEIVGIMSRFSCSLESNDQEKTSSQQELGPTCVLVTENEKLTSIFTQRDIVKLTAHGVAITQITLKDVIKTPLITLKDSQIKEIFTALSIFRQYKIRHLPVVDDHGKPVGIITHNTIRRSLLSSNFLTQLRQAKDIMTSHIIHGKLTSSMLEIAQLMTENLVSCVVICEQLNEQYLTPLGIITERDIVQFQALELDLAQTQASQVMSYPLFSLQPNDYIQFANEQMELKKVRRLVVLGQNNELMGIISQSSILQVLNPVYMYGMIEILQQSVTDRTKELEETNLQLKEEIQQKKEAEINLKKTQESLIQLVEERTAQLTEMNHKWLFWTGYNK